MTKMISTPLTLEFLQQLVAGTAAAIRGSAVLQPAGGMGDKVFPPTHSVDKRASTRYATEKRRINGQETDCVLLDSVQSQANRMEQALQRLWENKQIAIPVITVDLSEAAPEVGIVTSLSAPHRISDALLRDSSQDGVPFRLTKTGQSFTNASPNNAASLFKVCPTGLLFGLWDSTGPKGGLGPKFARVITSEIVGIGAVHGAKTASRIDPASITKKAAEILVAADPQEGWTHDPALAKQDKGKPVRLGDGKVSEVNHGNIPPTIDTVAGGVTIDHAQHIAIISLAGLRKLSFGAHSQEARTVLAAIGIVALLSSEAQGHDLRSRCLLIPEVGKHLTLEVIHHNGTSQKVSIDLEQAIDLLNTAIAELPTPLRFEQQPGEPLVTLTPSPKLLALIRKSRELAVVSTESEEE